MDTLRYSNLYDLFSSYSLDNIKSQYIDLLSFLTKVEDLSDTVFLQKVGTISKMGEILICYFVDVNGECVIIGTGTIFFEPKMIRGGKSVGHIEDIVVHPNYRSFGIATTIIRKLIDLGWKHNCYKLILDCKEEISAVYERSGFQRNGLQMALYADGL